MNNILLEKLHVFDVLEEERALGVEEKLEKVEIIIEFERSHGRGELEVEI